METKPRNINPEGIILAFDPPSKLVMSWRFLSFPDEFAQAASTAVILENGLPIVLSGMKSLVETGSSFTSI
ncbi:hypothetical protein LOZ80_10490 [Paenibacillus sp. HWE-109]|uniref:hypothetical protein n=1 Tax=Paenibacillus sp. HWE-109 TaxID=1306526 RepID=UPI001EDF434E|nr:hypothetical protein [Paenibacillus sp. HWE-109]UKS29327.1 hypothetical protein LOZ80_10490 [Paenibacillus sp. HWE-109]